MESRTPGAESSNKRPRSPTEYPQIASKAPKVQPNHLQINYLARQYTDDLPLVSLDDNMSGILHLIGEYDGVLQRHESIAGNLGACPLGPILISRFERLFDGPPRVLKSNAKETPSITWLDVVEFARSKPEQFNLERTRNGVRVCQFYTKQCRVEISEEDYVVIASGMPQKMIPPQPIIEDEEKELGSLEILEKNMQSIIQAADQVSARARQLNHRLKNRRMAIITRRENDASLHSHQTQSLGPTLRDPNGHVHPVPNGNVPRPSHSPTGFVAVNANRPGGEPPKDDAQLPAQFPFPHSNTDNVTIINGASIKGASPTTRAELMKKFFTTDRQARGLEEPAAAGQTSRPTSRPTPRPSDSVDYTAYQPPPATVAIPNTPPSLLPPPRSNNEKDDGGPYKMHMIARMEELQRGDRVMPPCDRCRRLQMDCVKNLTACIGCTKKHCKCAWKDVKEEEIRELEAQKMAQERASDPQRAQAMTTQSPPLAPIPSVPEHGRSRQEFTPHPEYRPDTNWAYDARRESAPVSSQAFGPRLAHDVSPRRAMSEVRSSAAPNHDPRLSQTPASTEPAADDDDPGANQRLMQAILDTVDHHARTGATKENGKEVSGDDKKGQMVRA